MEMHKEATFYPEKLYRKPPVTGKFWRISTAANEGWTLENISQSNFEEGFQ
jgi:hypothetical protein